MKMKSIFASMLAIAALVSCSDNSDEPAPPAGGDFETAYMSLRITYPTSTTKASTEENATPEESAINSLYVVTFDENKNLVHHSKENPVIVIGSTGFTTSSGTTTPNEAIRVSPSTKYLLIIANPGTILRNRLNALTSGASYTDFNQAVSVSIATTVDRDSLANEIRTLDAGTAKNFTMINAGFYNKNVANDWDPDCLLDVTGNIVEVGENVSESDAKTAAQADGKRASLKIERLAAKMVVTEGSSVTVLPAGAQFEFTNWALDYRNSTFFPFATKTNISATHTTGFYDNNFYTVDPNFTTPGLMTGIIKNEVINRAPKVGWNDDGDADYCIENTMAEDDQLYGAATRVVIKAKYAPAGYSLTADWFSFGSDTYQTLALLQTAYTTAKDNNTNAALITACDNFLAAVKVANTDVTTADFLALTEGELNDITDGGEITKIPNCIRWYQKSVAYYYYEIRHDNTNDTQMGYGKYGVVRSNWYALNLIKVNGKGTPWYPGEGPGEPDPEDPIDEGTAYLSFDIQVGPWIYWTTDFEI